MGHPLAYPLPYLYSKSSNNNSSIDNQRGPNRHKGRLLIDRGLKGLAKQATFEDRKPECQATSHSLYRTSHSLHRQMMLAPCDPSKVTMDRTIDQELDETWDGS